MFPEDQRVASVLTEQLATRDFGHDLYITQAKDPLTLKFSLVKEGDTATQIPHGWHRGPKLWTYMGKIYVPPILCQDLFWEMHTKGQAAHPGVKGTTAVIVNDYYWPGLRSDVQEWIKNCDTCQRMKNQNKKPHGTLKPIDPAPRFWELSQWILSQACHPAKGSMPFLQPQTREERSSTLRPLPPL